MRVSPSVAAPGAGPADGTAHDTEVQVLIAEARARARRRRSRVGLALVCAAALGAARLAGARGVAWLGSAEAGRRRRPLSRRLLTTSSPPGARLSSAPRATGT